MILHGLAVTLAIGVGVGVANYALIKLLRIPPIIATLSMSFLVQSTAIWTNRGLRIKPPDSAGRFRDRCDPWHSERRLDRICLVGAGLGAVASHGLWPLDRGYRAKPARSADGGHSGRWHAALSPISCAPSWRPCAATLLSCFSGGAALNMGAEYLLISIAVVVIGGTAVAGGDSNVPGIWGASLFMFLVVSMLNTYGFGAGVRLIMTGLIIISVILVASGRQAGALGGAMTQPQYQIDDDRFRFLTVGSSRLDRLYGGCRWAEGPVWFNDLGCLLWSDIPNQRILRWSAEHAGGAGGVGIPQPVQLCQRSYPRCGRGGWCRASMAQGA